MTNEQALGRALALLMATSRLHGSGDIARPCELSQDQFESYAVTTDKFDELVSDIDKFLDSDFRRED
jgi:hypothetical protein